MVNELLRETLTFKWTVSRGRETYGYNICSLYVEGSKVTSCNGGGYDMEGTVLADYVTAKFQPLLRLLADSNNTSKEYYGLFLQKDKSAYIDGACGFDSVRRIIKALGYELTKLNYRSKGDTSVYLLEAIE